MENDDYTSKVLAWLDTEGYPLEFRTAHEFKTAGFEVLQGEYLGRGDGSAPREVDVTAFKSILDREHLVRVHHLIECKVSRNKPWVVFTSPKRLSSAACAAQSIGSDLGRAALWAIAGSPDLASMSLFTSPTRSGFNGRQATLSGHRREEPEAATGDQLSRKSAAGEQQSKKSNVDHFYNSMQSVTSLATLLAREYDHEERPALELPFACIAVFPVVVVDGRLFESWYDGAAGNMLVEERQHIRIHWRGAAAWHHHATIDIVAADFMKDFARARSSEVSCLLTLMARARDQIAECFASRSLDPLEVFPGGRGVLGLPPLLRAIPNAEDASDEDLDSDVDGE